MGNQEEYKDNKKPSVGATEGKQFSEGIDYCFKTGLASVNQNQV
jgi:hypothetical protein